MFGFTFICIIIYNRENQVKTENLEEWVLLDLEAILVKTVEWVCKVLLVCLDLKVDVDSQDHQVQEDLGFV